MGDERCGGVGVARGFGLWTRWLRSVAVWAWLEDFACGSDGERRGGVACGLKA